MKSPVLSVLVPNHNNASLLGECLDSILEQSFRELEIVVYDDASSDDSVAIVEEYMRKEPQRVRLIRGTEKGGPAHARNQAALASRGRYLTTLDADDVFADPGKLEREMSLVNRIRQEEGVDAAAFSDVLEVSPNGDTKLWGDHMKINEGWIRDHLLIRSGFVPRDFVFPRKVFSECGGFDPRLRTHEDWDLKIRLAGILPFYFTGAPGTAYHRRETGLSQINRRRRLCNLWRIYRRYRKLLKPEMRRQADRAFGKLMRDREKDNPSLEAALRRFACGRIDAILAPRRQANRIKQWTSNQS